jgi:hypothetical protein
MKYLISILSFFTLSFGEDGSSVRVFTDKQIKTWRIELSDENLTKAFNDESLSQFPLDRIQPIYESNVLNVESVIKSAPKNKNGYRLNSQKDKEFLIFLVETTRRYSQNFDPGNGHYRIFSKLYKAAPKDMSLAIERSSLSAYDKKIVKANIR